LRLLAREAAKQSWFGVYCHCASLLLDRETHLKITRQCREIMGREPTDGIDMPDSSRPEEYKHRRTRHCNFKEGLAKLRAKQGKSVVVYSTENPRGYINAKDRREGG
jgi:hypothetical protein